SRASTSNPARPKRSSTVGSAASTTSRPSGPTTRAASSSAMPPPSPLNATARMLPAASGSTRPTASRLTPGTSSRPASSTPTVTTSRPSTSPATPAASSAPTPATSTNPGPSLTPNCAASRTTASGAGRSVGPPAPGSWGDAEGPPASGSRGAVEPPRRSAQPPRTGYCSRQFAQPSTPSSTRRASIRSPSSTSPCSGPQRGHRRWSVKRMYTSAPGPYDLPSCRVDRARHGPRARRHPPVLARGWPDPSRPGSGTTTPASDSRTRRPRTLAPAPAVGSEDGRALRVLGPLGGRFPHADVEDRVPHGLGEAALQLVEEVARLVLRTRLDVRERREVVEVLVVQALGELAQVVLD